MSLQCLISFCQLSSCFTFVSLTTSGTIATNPHPGPAVTSLYLGLVVLLPRQNRLGFMNLDLINIYDIAVLHIRAIFS